LGHERRTGGYVQSGKIKADQIAGHHVGLVPPTTAIETTTDHDQDHNDDVINKMMM
jgi:hypothetical protein